MEVLEANKDLVLVSPAFPGFASRKLRQRPTTRRGLRLPKAPVRVGFFIEIDQNLPVTCVRPIPKMNSGLLYGSVEAEDITCQHPYTLPGKFRGVLKG